MSASRARSRSSTSPTRRTRAAFGALAATTLSLSACAFWDMSTWSDKVDAPADAAADAVPGDGDAAPPPDGGRFCSAGTAIDAGDGGGGGGFCEDFDDDDGVVGPDWTTTSRSGVGASVSISKDRVWSTPQSLRVETPHKGTALIARSLPGVVHHLHYEARVFVDRSDDAGAYFCHQELTLPNGNVALRLAVYETGTTLGQSMAVDAQPERTSNVSFKTPIPMHAWAKVAIDADFTTKPGVATVRLNGDIVVDRAALDPLFVPAPLLTATGITYARTSANADARWIGYIDDVRVTWD